MKIRTETVSVPEEQYDVTHYGCEEAGCDFESTDEADVKKHRFQKHVVKKELTRDGTHFYWFESEEDAKGWLEERDDHSERTHLQGWTGPGWYGTTSSEERGGCRCGGCSYFLTTLKPLADYAEDWVEEISTHEDRIAVLRQLVADVSTL